MPSHQFKFCRKVKRLRRLATTLANVADVAELLQRHAVLVHCSTVHDAHGVPSFGPTTPLSAKQAQEAIHRLRSGRSHDGMASPGARGRTASLFAQPPVAATPTTHPVLRWKHPELFPGTIMLPKLERTLSQEAQNQVDDRSQDRQVVKTQFAQPLTVMRTNNHTTGFDFQHIKQSTEADISLIHPHLETDASNTHNTPGGDSSSRNTEELQPTQKTNKSDDTGYLSQNVMTNSQLHIVDVKPTCESKASLKMKDSSTLTEGTVTAHVNSTDTKLTKGKSVSDKAHGGSDHHVPQWPLAASQIHFKPLPQTPNRPIQPHADDFMLVMHLLEKDHKNDPNYLRTIGIAVSNKHMRSRCTASKRLQTSKTILPTPPKQSLVTSTNRAQLSKGVRRCHRSSATQRRQNHRIPKNSAQKKPHGGGPRPRPSAYGKQSVCKPPAAAPKAPNIQKRQSSTSQRVPKFTTAVPQQRAAPEAKRVAQTPASNQKKLPIVSSGACRASQSSVSNTQTSKTLPASTLRRVLETSTAKTQNVLKRAASDCQRLSRISTPSTNSLLKRVASDLKKISRDSMTSFHNLRAVGRKLSVPKTSSTRTVEGVCLKNSVILKNSKEPLSHSSSREIKCHMPVVTASTERYCVTQITSAKPCVTKTLRKFNTLEAKKSIPHNPVSTVSVLEANRKPQPKNQKQNPFDARIEHFSNTQDAGKCTPLIPCPKMPLPETSPNLIQDAEKTKHWEGLRPPDCCTNALQQNSTPPPLFGLQLPPSETITVQPVGVHNIWDGLQCLPTKATLIPKSPCLPPFKPLTKECVPQPEKETKICNLPQPSEREEKECVFCTGLSSESNIKTDKEDMETCVLLDTTTVSAVSTQTHTATTKSLISHSRTSQESLMAVETLSSRKYSLSSSASSTDSLFSSDTASHSEVSCVTITKRDYSTCDDSQSAVSGKSSASSKRSPFFRKVKNVFRNRFSRCKSKLPCLRSRGCICVSASSLN